MRKVLAVILAGLFLILFFLATTVNQVVDTASDPSVVTGMLDDADAYDYVYDNIVGNLVHDVVSKGIEVNSGLDDSAAPTVLNFDDPYAAALAITDLIETLVPREYVQEKLEESLNGVVPYAKGEVDEFTIDLEVQERVRQVPSAVRDVVTELDLAERIIEDLLVPQLDQFSEDVSTQALGIELTDAEIEAAVREIFEPTWLEGQLFAAVDEITPFFAGDTESFEVVLQFDDRAVVIGRILKDKLVQEDTLYNLVFNQVVDPLIEQTVAQSTSVGFGISLTEQEVVDTFEVIAPREWVQDQGEGVIDALIEYLVGKSNTLEYTVDLSERKVTATEELQELAIAKLTSTFDDIPDCTSPADALGATQDIASQQLPRCLAGGQATIDLALNSFSSVMDTQVVNFVEQQVPSEVSYSKADLDAQLGGQLDTIDDLRARIIDGVSFTDQDLIDALSDGSTQSRADAEEALTILANGVMFTEANILENIDPAALEQYNDARDYAGTALSLKWILWVLVVIPLVIIALIGSGSWAGRLKWAGGVAAVCGLLVYAGIAVAWSFNDLAQDYIPDYGTRVSAEFRADYPRLSAELESDELNTRFQRALDSWQQNWREQTVPWIIAGAVAFAAGTAMTIVGGSKGTPMGGGPAYTGSAPSTTGSAVTSIPKEWGDDPEEESNDDSATDDDSQQNEESQNSDSETKT